MPVIIEGAQDPPRIHSLDGLRALSIAMVLMGHLYGTRHSHIPVIFEQYANFGVRVFFVISGYLITSILLKEHHKTGTISLRDFYVRRAFRIFPAAYVYLTMIVVVFGSALRWADIASGYGYLANYDLSRPWLIGHLWSLSIEEQFYLLWPLMLLLFFARRKELAVAAILGAPLMRVAFKLSGFSGTAIGNYFPCVVDTLATGCLLALLQPQMDEWAPLLQKRRFALVPLVALSVPLWPLWSRRFGVPGYQLVGITVMNFGIALCIEHCLRKRYALLNHKALVRIGVLSYSLYLWQQPFIDRSSDAWYAAFPVNMILAFGFAALSYFCVERPFLRLRERCFATPAPAPSFAKGAID